MKNTKVEPNYMKTARRIAKAAWECRQTKKSRESTTRYVAKAFKDYEKKIQSEAICVAMILKCGYGTTSPQFKCAMKRFKELVKSLERGYATGNAWLELVNKENG